VVVNSLAIGATRAPAFVDGILAVDKRGQMNGGSGGARLVNILISGVWVSHSTGDARNLAAAPTLRVARPSWSPDVRDQIADGVRCACLRFLSQVRLTDRS
jgi:hypothetical protein